MSDALFENDPRVAEVAVLTGEVIGFAFEAPKARHMASSALETVLVTGARGEWGWRCHLVATHAFFGWN